MPKTYGRKVKAHYSDSLNIGDIPSPIFREPHGKNRKGMFDEPRKLEDRRRRNNASAIPVTGCRRTSRRRTTVYMDQDQWWMKRNYNKET